jgi:hypothetical protein
MDWRFINSNTLKEHDTGYIIRLLGGLGFTQKKLSPKHPQAWCSCSKHSCFDVGWTTLPNSVTIKKRKQKRFNSLILVYKFEILVWLR